MAVDHSLLPENTPAAIKPPSKRLWAIVFIILAAAIAVAIVWLWPTAVAVSPWRFWTTITLFPIGVPLWIVLRRFSVHEGKLLDSAMRAEAARAYNQQVFDAASRPMHLLGSAFRISFSDEPNSISRINAGDIKLACEETPAGDPRRARWIDIPVHGITAHDEDDTARQAALAHWMFDGLLRDLSTTLHGLPRSEHVEVMLWIDSALKPDVVETVWRDCWKRHLRQGMHIAHDKAPKGLSILGKWLDQMIEGKTCSARLVVAVQMYPIHTESPPQGSSEAAVALLLVTDTFASKYGTNTGIQVHRPVRGAQKEAGEALAHAAQWGSVSCKQISQVWQTASNGAPTGSWLKFAHQLGPSADVTNLDEAVGYAGVAAPWLVLACGAQSVAAGANSCIVHAEDHDGLDIAVIKARSGVHEMRHGKTL